VIKEKTAMNRNSSGRRYDREFKNNAVALVRGGRTITEVARDLGVQPFALPNGPIITGSIATLPS
jgi:transposase-like protein